MRTTTIYEALVSIVLLSAAVESFAPLARSSCRQSTTKCATTTTSLSAIATAELAPRNVPPLESWAIESGIQKIDGLELYTEDGLDYQYIATADIPSGTTLMYIPAGVCLSSSIVAQELNAMSPTGGVAAAVDKLNKIGGQNSVADFYLFVKLLVEYEAQENSPYFAWLDSLPRLYYNAVSMTDFCYECLPPLVFSLSRLEKVKFDNFKQVVANVDIISDYVKSNEEVLKWAFNAVYTRAYADKDGQGSDVTITPLGDMFNHGTETEVEVSFFAVYVYVFMYVYGNISFQSISYKHPLMMI